MNHNPAVLVVHVLKSGASSFIKREEVVFLQVQLCIPDVPTERQSVCIQHEGGSVNACQVGSSSMERGDISLELEGVPVGCMDWKLVQ